MEKGGVNDLYSSQPTVMEMLLFVIRIVVYTVLEEVKSNMI